MDYFAELYAIPNQEASAVTKAAMVKDLISPFGVPLEVYSN